MITLNIYNGTQDKVQLISNTQIIDLQFNESEFNQLYQSILNKNKVTDSYAIDYSFCESHSDFWVKIYKVGYQETNVDALLDIDIDSHLSILNNYIKFNQQFVNIQYSEQGVILNDPAVSSLVANYIDNNESISVDSSQNTFSVSLDRSRAVLLETNLGKQYLRQKFYEDYN